MIPCYNHADFLPEAVASALAQAVDLEVIVVDDGSTQDLSGVVAPLLADTRVRYLRQENQGPGAARNLGIAASQSPFVCFLDADDRLELTSIAKRLDFFVRHPDVGMVFTDMQRVADTGERNVHLRSHGFLDKFAPAITAREGSAVVFGAAYVECAIEFGPCIVTCTVMVRRAVLDDVGPFVTDLRAGEDTDLWLRIVEHGPIGFIDEPLSTYHQDRSILTADTETFFRDHIRYFEGFSRRPLASRIAAKLERRLALYHFELGLHYLRAGRGRDAREHLGAAARMNATPRYRRHHLLSRLPAGVAQRILAWQERAG